MGKILVDTELLKSVAGKLSSNLDVYSADYKRLYTEIASMMVEFNGEASTTFNQRIEGYRTSFEELEAVVEGMVQYLQDVATGYELGEEALTAEAAKLASGN